MDPKDIDAMKVPLSEPLEEAAIQEFAAGFLGQVIRPGDSGYDEARTVYNGMIDKRPALIVRPAGQRT